MLKWGAYLHPLLGCKAKNRQSFTATNFKAIIMAYTKQQKEIIALAVALMESDIEVADIRKDAHLILGDLQKQGVWGDINIYNEEI